MTPKRLHSMDIIYGQVAIRWSEQHRAWVHSGTVIIKRAKAQRLAARLNYLMQVSKYDQRN